MSFESHLTIPIHPLTPSLGSIHTLQTYTVQGIIEQACEDLFAYTATHSATRQFTLRCSIVEIYNEFVHCLLKPESKVEIREDLQRHVFLSGCHQVECHSLADVHKLLAQAAQQRHVAATAMNERSSRSHVLFRMQVESEPRHDADAASNPAAVTAPPSTSNSQSRFTAQLTISDLVR